jgi:hypothetical protein
VRPRVASPTLSSTFLATRRRTYCPRTAIAARAELAFVSPPFLLTPAMVHMHLLVSSRDNRPFGSACWGPPLVLPFFWAADVHRSPGLEGGAKVTAAVYRAAGIIAPPFAMAAATAATVATSTAATPVLYRMHSVGSCRSTAALLNCSRVLIVSQLAASE